MILKYNEHGQPYEDLTVENKRLMDRVQELEKSLTAALEINDTYQRDNKKLKERAQEAEGEVTIVKGIGMNSPEMRAAHAEIDRLSEENTNLKTMMKDGKNTSNSC